MRRGAIVTRMKSGGIDGRAGARGAVDVMVELLSYFQSLPVYAPLVTHVREDGVPLWWTQGQVTKALRALVAKCGYEPEYALHSLRIGDAIQHSAGGASSDTVQKEGW